MGEGIARQRRFTIFVHAFGVKRVPPHTHLPEVEDKMAGSKAMDSIPSSKVQTVMVLQVLGKKAATAGGDAVDGSGTALTLGFTLKKDSAESVIQIELLIPDIGDYKFRKHAGRALTLKYRFKEKGQITIVGPVEPRDVYEDRLMQMLHYTVAMDKGADGRFENLDQEVRYFRKILRTPSFYYDNDWNTVKDILTELIDQEDITEEDHQGLEIICDAIWNNSKGKMRQELLYWIQNKYQHDLPDEALTTMKQERNDGEVTLDTMGVKAEIDEYEIHTDGGRSSASKPEDKVYVPRIRR